MSHDYSDTSQTFKSWHEVWQFADWRPCWASCVKPNVEWRHLLMLAVEEDDMILVAVVCLSLTLA